MRSKNLLKLGLMCLLLFSGKVWASEGIEVDTGTTAWMLTSTALVLLMIPGLAMFYGGLVRTKNVIGTMMHTFVALAIIGVLWALVGYSLTFGESHFGGFIGWNNDYFMLKGIDDSIINGVPEYVVAMFQGKFAIITPALISGALAERVYFRGYFLFIALWFLIIYCPLAHWIWAPDGWLTNSGAAGVIDLAGGLVIHVSAGTSALVVALFLGARRDYSKTAMPPNNLVMTLMGAGLLWVGWFGFNAGSTNSSGLETARALTMTQISAAAGALTWLAIEAIKFKKVTSLGFVSGILAGLVVITPAAGVVQPYGAVILGAVSAFGCYYMIGLKDKLGYDDSLDCFGIHGVGSGTGVILLAFFIRKSWMEAAAMNIGSSWTAIDQLLIQMKGMGVTILFSATGTLLICYIAEKLVGFRLPANKEMAGLDSALHSEHGYGMLNLG